MDETEIGKVTHYYNKIGVAIIELSDTLKVGDTIKIKDGGTELEQTVESMQIEHENIEAAKASEVIGLKVKDKVHEGDTVYRKA